MKSIAINYSGIDTVKVTISVSMFVLDLAKRNVSHKLVTYFAD